MSAVESVLAQFQSSGAQTCFHGRHIEPQIYAGLDRSSVLAVAVEVFMNNAG